MILYALFATLITGISDVFRKKSLSYGVGGKVHDLLGYPIGVGLTIYFLISGIDLSLIDWVILAGTFVILLVGVLKTQLYQKIYRKEKISLIIPYTNVNKILTIILSFFIFSDVSIISLMITFVAIIVIVLFSIDFKTFKLPKTIGLLLVAEGLTGIVAIGIGWLTINYGASIYFITFVILGVSILGLISGFLKEFKTLKGVKGTFYKNRLIAGLGWFSWFISLMVIKELGLSVSILLSFLGIGVTLFFSFLFLKDKPEKKDIVLTIIISSLVGLGFLLK